MKSVLRIGFLAVAAASPLVAERGACNADNCLRAVRGTPAVGAAFCSAYFSLTPATTVITETATVTSTLTNFEPSVETLSVTTGTHTDTATVTQLVKRTNVDPSSRIVSQCSFLASRVSSACGCFLSTTSTTTSYTTATITSVAEYTTTTPTTLTVPVEASTSETTTTTSTTVCVPSATPAVQNYGFDTWTPRNPSIAPWTNTSAVTGGTINGVYASGCTQQQECSSGGVLLNPRPLTTAGAYIGLLQNLTTCPDTTYALSFLYRCLNFDAASAVQTYFGGALVGSASCPNDNGIFFTKASGITFTSGDRGASTELEFRFVNGGSTPYLYYYFDSVVVTPVDSAPF